MSAPSPDPSQPGRGVPLWFWLLVGLLPSIFHAAMLADAFKGSNHVGEWYVLFMPVFALVYLIAVVTMIRPMRIAGGGVVPKLSYFLGMFGLNVVLWIGGCMVALNGL